MRIIKAAHERLLTRARSIVQQKQQQKKTADAAVLIKLDSANESPLVRVREGHIHRETTQSISWSRGHLAGLQQGLACVASLSTHPSRAV